MSVKIRLKRFGTKKRVYYRMVVVDSRAPRDGRTLEEVGQYHPIEAENQITLDAEKIKARAFAEFARRYGLEELLDAPEGGTGTDAPFL